MSDENLEPQTAESGMDQEPLESAALVLEDVPTPPAAGPGQVVYVGPRLLRPFPVGPLAVFRGVLPSPLAKAVAADADLAALFVPVVEAGTALRTVTQRGSALQRAAAAVTAKYVTRKEG